MVLSARAEHDDLVAGFTAGADDYLSKPYNPQELLLRVAAITRRRAALKSAGEEARSLATQLISRGTLVLDPVSAQATVNGVDIHLTRREFSLLLLFVHNEGELLDPNRLYEAVWGQPLEGDKNALQMAVSRLRNKLVGSPCDIKVTRGLGYTFRCRP